MPRYIDADAVNRVFVDELGKIPSVVIAERIEWTAAREAIIRCARGVSTIPTADVVERKNGKWVPVTERLPEENKPVLVTHHGKYQAFVSVDWIGPYTHEWNRTCNVTAWQPMPEPWKGEQDAEIH